MVPVLIYLEETNLENGCTHLVPGSHLLPSFSESNDVTRGVCQEQTLPVPMPAGGLLAMDGMTLHQAGVNRTDNTRMSITLGYHSCDRFASIDDEKRVLVCGERKYGGNDRA